MEGGRKGGTRMGDYGEREGRREGRSNEMGGGKVKGGKERWEGALEGREK